MTGTHRGALLVPYEYRSTLPLYPYRMVRLIACLCEFGNSVLPVRVQYSTVQYGIHTVYSVLVPGGCTLLLVHVLVLVRITSLGRGKAERIIIDSYS